ncbi:MAG: GNAT family N-acetyltransferase [Gammaproteobacteria bacterium]|nr:GNAT family N-acetyltransferase [Gammaproteobacteria bacterium]
MNSFRVQPVSFMEQQPAIYAVRNAVFVQEQGIDASAEWDGQDQQAQHVLAWDQERQPIGTGRLLIDGRIGRMAVLPAWRRHGVGRHILEQLLRIAAKQGKTQVYLSAQVAVLGFYTRAGFIAQGEHYIEEGILHQKMCRDLSQVIHYTQSNK